METLFPIATFQLWFQQLATFDFTIIGKFHFLFGGYTLNDTSVKLFITQSADSPAGKAFSVANGNQQNGC